MYRTAIVTAMFLILPVVAHADVITIEGTCRGRIITERQGSGGFGYDPLFLIPEFHQTFGELSPAVKRCLSHRARAFARFIPSLLEIATEFEH